MVLLRALCIIRVIRMFQMGERGHVSRIQNHNIDHGLTRLRYLASRPNPLVYRLIMPADVE